MKNALLVVPLLSAGLLAAGCARVVVDIGRIRRRGRNRGRERARQRELGRLEHRGVGHRGKPDRLEHGGGLRYLGGHHRLVRYPRLHLR